MASYKFRTWLKQSQGFGLTGTGPPPTDDLTAPTRDSVFTAQLQKADPTALDAESLLTAKIVETQHYGNSVFRTLISQSVIDAAGHPDTTKIDRSLVSKIAILPVPKCRELVNMLFWWEEELMRWRLLDEEVRELEGSIAAAAAKGEAEAEAARAAGEEKLAVLEARKRVVPSLRASDGSVKTHGEGAGLPEYRA